MIEYMTAIVVVFVLAALGTLVLNRQRSQAEAVIEERERQERLHLAVAGLWAKVDQRGLIKQVMRQIKEHYPTANRQERRAVVSRYLAQIKNT